MKLLVYVPSVRRLYSEDPRSIGDVYAYNLLRYLPLWCGTVVADHKTRCDQHEADAALVLADDGLAKAKRRGVDLLGKLKSLVGGWPVAVLSDSCRGEMGDMIFGINTLRRGERASVGEVLVSGWPTGVHVGWAADSQRFRPVEHPWFRVLIDHRRETADDRTGKLLHLCLKHRDETEEMEIRWLTGGGVVHVCHGTRCDKTGAVPSEIFAAELSLADVFCVTHPESVGLGMLEAAMSGCLLLIPKGYARPELIADLKHVEWEGEIDWRAVHAAADPVQCRLQALRYDHWAEIARTMCESLKLCLA